MKFLLPLKTTITCKVVCLLMLFSSSVFAYNKKLEPILQTSPSIDASEYILIENKNLALSLAFITKMNEEIDNSTETTTVKQIRKAHLHYLKSYAYIYHTDTSLKKIIRFNRSQLEIAQALDIAYPIIKNNPKYSDILRLASVSTLLYGELGILGKIKMLHLKNTALDMISKAIMLNPDNMMARVVRSNFDALAPPSIGADRSRGLETILKVIPDNLPAPQKFEVFVSRYHSYSHINDTKNKNKVIKELITLYPMSWRIQTLLQ